MRPIPLCYHDVIADGTEFDSSGFRGPDVATYKLPLGVFRQHLAAIGEVHVQTSTSDAEPLRECGIPLLTFDDGGFSAVTLIADELERVARRGLFFIPTDFIGQNGFLPAAGILNLHERGHVIGSHSCTHRGRMSRFTANRLDAEWTMSRDALSSIIGAPVVTASVPSGYYSKDVARAASRAGIRFLFTQEPTTRIDLVDECLVMGRYTVRSWTTAQTIGLLASGQLSPRIRQWALWALKRAAKSTGGTYTRFRSFYYSSLKGRHSDSRPPIQSMKTAGSDRPGI
jgi:peptidoglycan/xylan/chitin deacetylase (PgdA/CDA1 family)